MKQSFGYRTAMNGTIAFVATVCAIPIFAQSPAKPIRILVGFSAGSGTYGAARMVGRKLSEMLGQPFLVENRPGSGGMIATEMVSKAPPDGSTLLMMAAADSIQPAMRVKMPYNLPQDFSPLAYVATGIFVLTVHPSVPARNVKELINLARTKAGGLNFATSGIGASAHFAGELFNHIAKVRTIAVAYQGSPQAALAVVSGEVDLAYPTYTSARPLLDASRLRALAVTTARRSVLMPHTPTMHESGLLGYDRAAWYGVVGPRGMPPELVNRLADVIGKAAGSPEIKANLLEQGLVAETSTPQEFSEFIRREVEQNIELGRLAGLRKQ